MTRRSKPKLNPRTLERRVRLVGSETMPGLQHTKNISRFIPITKEPVGIECSISSDFHKFFNDGMFIVFYHLIKSRDFILIRYLLGLKFDNLLLKFQIISLEFSYVLLDVRFCILKMRIQIGHMLGVDHSNLNFDEPNDPVQPPAQEKPE